MVNLNEVFPPALAPVRNRNIELSASDKVIIWTILLIWHNCWWWGIQAINTVCQRFTEWFGW